jgi:hypothetical protein
MEDSRDGHFFFIFMSLKATQAKTTKRINPIKSQSAVEYPNMFIPAVSG